jgi:hypothetical protein
VSPVIDFRTTFSMAPNRAFVATECCSVQIGIGLSALPWFHSHHCW